MSDDVMKNFLALQCMDFTKYLASQGHFFKFSLKMRTFSFNLETTETRIPTTVTTSKKKESPSTLARNARRKADFLAKKISSTSDEKGVVVGDPTAEKEKEVGDPTAMKETAVMDDPAAIPVDRDVD